MDKNASEVLNMLMTEWNTTEFGKVQRAEGVAATLLDLVERKMHIEKKPLTRRLQN